MLLYAFAFVQSLTSSGTDFTHSQGRYPPFPEPSSPCRDKRHLLLLSKTWGWSGEEALSSVNKEIAIQLEKNPQLQVSCLAAQTSRDLQDEASTHYVNLVGAECKTGFTPVQCLSFPPHFDVGVDCVIGYGMVVGPHAQHIKPNHPNSKWAHIAQSSENVDEELCRNSDVAFAIGADVAEECERQLRFYAKEVGCFTPGIFSEFQTCTQRVEVKQSTFSLIAFYPSTELVGYDIPAKLVGMFPGDRCRLICVVPQNGTEEIKNTLLRHGISSNKLTLRSHPQSLETLCKWFVEADLLIMPFLPFQDERFGLIALQAISANLPVLVSYDTGLGIALKDVLFGSMCIVYSDRPEDWRRRIEIVKQTERSNRLQEASKIREYYDKKYSWERQCNMLWTKISAQFLQ